MKRDATSFFNHDFYRKRLFKIAILFLFAAVAVPAAPPAIPSVYSAIQQDDKGVYLDNAGVKVYSVVRKDHVTLDGLIPRVTGGPFGLTFKFKDAQLSGFLYYGLMNTNARYPLPVYSKKIPLIADKTCEVNIAQALAGVYFDIVNWARKGRGIVGYRIVTRTGKMLYDGRVAFTYKNERFTPVNTIYEGPLVNKVTATSVTLTFKTTKNIPCAIKIAGKTRSTLPLNGSHTVTINGLSPNKLYTYTVINGNIHRNYSFRTAMSPGDRTPFTFAYASDSRGGCGGGEREFYGVNSYIVKKVAAVSARAGARFIQFSGDMINGYSTNQDVMNLQYANWKQALEPWWHSIPIYCAMGNHENYPLLFQDPATGFYRAFDNFPFATHSSESLFAAQFTNFENGPISEDGSACDPNPQKIDFPSYRENVYFYQYGNVAMIVLNSDYLYSASIGCFDTQIDGNAHGYIMDNQLAWLQKTLATLEKNKAIDHIFITLHSPVFPNGGHTQNAMWYSGNNAVRPIIAGKRVKTGIIERRDQLLDLLVNKSRKTVAILTGDEHNYNRLRIAPDMQLYPPAWKGARLTLSRTIYQINNGAAGAPCYNREKLPWSDHLEHFSVQNAVVLVHVNGKKIRIETRNPDTLELLDSFNPCPPKIKKNAPSTPEGKK